MADIDEDEGYRPLPIPLLGRFIEADIETRILCNRVVDCFWKVIAYGAVALVVFGAWWLWSADSRADVRNYEREHDCTFVDDEAGAAGCTADDELGR